MTHTIFKLWEKKLYLELSLIPGIQKPGAGSEQKKAPQHFTWAFPVTCQNCFPIRGLKKTFFPRNLAAFPTYSTFFSDIKKVQYRTRNVQHDPGGPTFPVEYSLHVVLDALLPGQASPSYRNSCNYWKKIRKMWREEEWGKGEGVGGGRGEGVGEGRSQNNFSNSSKIG